MLSKENIQNIYPLSPMQEGMFFHALYEPDSPAYFEQLSYRVHGELDIQMVEKSLNELVKRYDILRTVFSRKKSEKLLQIVLNERKADFYYEDISHMDDKEAYVADFREKDRAASFDLTQDVLMRTAILQLGPKEYEFVWSHHHILMDGWCVGILIADFFEIYGSLVKNRPAQLAPVIPYNRYIRWLGKQSKTRAQDYWTLYVAGYMETAAVPRKKTEKDQEDYMRGSFRLSLDKETSSRLYRFAVDRRVTQNTLVQSLWGILLARYTRYRGEEDVIFGAVVSGRPSEIQGVETMVGLFINTIPVRIRIEPGIRLNQLMQTIQKRALESEAFHYFPLAEIQSHSLLKQNLFDHIMAFQNFPIAERIKSSAGEKGDSGSGLKLKVAEVESFEQINYDFGILVDPGEQLSFRFDYNADVYDPEIIEGIARHLKHLMYQFIEMENPLVEEMSILPEEEKERILVDFNNTSRDYPGDKTLHQLFEEQADTTPNNIAVTVFSNNHTTHLTYKELDEKSNRLACHLIERGITPGTIIALKVTPSIDMAAAILGILKAGGAYLPIDPEYPEERTDYMLADSGAKVLLSQGDLADVSTVHTDVGLLNDVCLKSSDLAYIIYTSGTTGRPKGAAVEHRNVVNTLLFRKEAYNMTTGDVALQLFSYSFDGFVTSFFTPLISGAELVLTDGEVIKDPRKLVEIITNRKVTHFIAIPPLYNAVLEFLTPAGAASLKAVTLAGDSVPPRLLEISRDKNPAAEIVNEYGVTEASVLSTLNRNQEKDPVISIGKPIWNTAIYILGLRDRVQPVGVPGELCIAGAGVARGYLNNPELTAEKFTPLSLYPSTPLPLSTPLYRTGDLARRLSDGSIQLLGRTDLQVKIRGYRIETGEIENRLSAYEGVKDVVVSTIETMAGELSLCAYIVPRNYNAANTFKQVDLRGFLSLRLPTYMIPSHFVFLETLPLTPNGKIDRKALPLPDVSGASAYEAPRTETEKKLVNIWGGILKLRVEDIGIDSSFFDLGGHSLNVVSMSTSVHKIFNVKLELADIFGAPTIRALAQLVDGRTQVQFFSIEPCEEKKFYRASSAQKRIYLLQQMDIERVFYNMNQVVELAGRVIPEKIAATVQELVNRHESFRTSFHMRDGEPVQEIHPEVVPEIQYYNVVDSKESVNDVIRNFIRPFDLSRAPLFRVGIITSENANDLMIIDMHHIISDFVSQVVLERDFSVLVKGGSLPPLKVRYRDYSEWQHSVWEKEALIQQEVFWRTEFEDGVPVLNLPSDFPRPVIQSFEGRCEYFSVDSDTYAALKRTARETGATLYMVLLAAANILFSKLSSQDVIVIGTPVAGRRHADLENIIGMFVNTLAVKNHPCSEKTVTAFLQELKTKTLAVFENQDYPFEELIEILDVKRDAGRNPLFDVMFTLDTVDTGTWSISKRTDARIEFTTSKFDITLMGSEVGERIFFALEYCTRLFKRETILRFIEYFKRITSSIASKTDRKIAEIELLSEEEKQQILFDYNNTRTQYPAHKTITQLFAEQAVKTPGNIAVEYNDRVMTYAELDRESDVLAAVLVEKGVSEDIPVGIMAERSLEAVTGVVGILKAGGVYMPIEADYPPERVKFMLADSNAKILLTKLSDVNTITAIYENVETIDLNALPSRPFHYSPAQLSPTSLAYIIYTSGSTGSPKGVMVEHRSVVRLVKDTNFVDLKSDDRIMQTGALAFDASTFEIWGALLNGLSLYLADKDKIMTPGSLKQIIQENHVTTMWMTAPLFNQMVQEDEEIFGSLRNLLVGGDVLSPPHINRLRQRFPQVNIINGYGPTENTTFSTTFLVEKDYTGRIPIGSPIANSTVYIFDNNDNVQAPGINGELCVGGDGVARGYMNNPFLTHEKFTSNPHVAGERLYRTGDLARWLPGEKGIVDFCGRFDDQVKIRGFRVEPGEIEMRLLNHDMIREAVVMVVEDGPGSDLPDSEAPSEKRLCAYIVYEDKTKNVPGIVDLREYLAQGLPDYMIPACFVELAEMPLTANGKIDRSALSRMEGVSMETGTTYEAPRNEIEQKLSDIWQAVLGIPEVGIREDFFTLGGDSIKAIQIKSRLNNAGYKIEMKDIFQYPTIAQLAPYATETREVSDQSVITGPVPLTPIQREFFQTDRTDPHHFNQAVMFHATEFLEEALIRAIFLKLQSHHDALRMIYKREPGGTVIQENLGSDLPLSLRVFDLRREADAAKVLEAKADEIQASINLESGPLMNIGHFHMEDGDRLLIVIHHLVVDGVSWRILFEDIETLYNYYREHGTVESVEFAELPLKTASFKSWSKALEEFAGSELFLKEEKKYWQQLEAQAADIPSTPKDFPDEIRNFISEAATLSFSLSPEETELLLTRVNDAFGTEINDILLTAFGLSMKGTFGFDRVLLAMEGHGREEILKNIDITRTVGWFTGVYPVILDFSSAPGDDTDLSRTIIEVKETLRKLPHKGVGYGILKYLSPEEKKEDIVFRLKPVISFNYLGQFDQDVKKISFQIATESAGNDQSPNAERDYELEVSGSVAAGRLQMSIRYNKNHFDPATIDGLLSKYKAELVRLISYCTTRESKELTPSDFSYGKLSVDTLEALDSLVSRIK